jgi:kynurenine 3-monooxygenase
LHLPIRDGGGRGEMELAEVLSQFPDLNAHLKRKDGSNHHPPVGRMSTVRCSSWHVEDRVVLVGDASHGVIPYLGQGANAGLEDCAVLSEIIAASGPAFSVFEQSRKPDLDLLADLCFGHMHFLRSKLGINRQKMSARVERILSQQISERSLYYNISFTHLSYRDAFAQSRAFEFWHSRIVNELQDIEDADETKVREVVAHVLSRARLGERNGGRSTLSA